MGYSVARDCSELRWSIPGMVDLYLADCLAVLPGLEDGGFDSIVTDPPYGVNYKRWKKSKNAIKNDDQPCVWAFAHNSRLLSDRGCVFCFCRWDRQEAFRDALTWSRVPVRCQVVWDRDWPGMGDTKRAWSPRHDVAWFASRQGFAFPGGRPQSVLRYRKPAPGKLKHPTEKPLELMREIVRNTPPGAVLDPYMGSGSTGVAAVLEGRRFVGIELDEQHFETAKARIAEAYEQVVGQSA